MMRKIKIKKVLFISSLFSTLIVTSVVSAACATAPQQTLSDKKLNVVPSNTPYETIHNLEFSLQFSNTGGEQNPGAPKSQIQSDSYSVYGTGWLFDWKLDSDKPDTNGNINWTGYFATNLHVANALLNQSDGEYTPSWLTAGPKSGKDYTFNFSLGKYDNDPNSPLSSTNKNTNLTYVTLGVNNKYGNSLPTTQFAATNFMNGLKLNGKDPQTGALTSYLTYIDFAVLAVNISYIPASISPAQIAINDVYKYWIEPAMQTLKTLYPQNTTNNDLTYKELFDATPYLNQIKPNPGNIYIGGYPFYNSANKPYYPFVGVGNQGSPVWTINADKDASVYNGQPIDINDESRASGPLTPNGIYNANSQVNFVLNYHGVTYKMYGIGYIVNDSNLAGGSSGSMALTSKNKLLGIYFGTLSDDSGNESPVGLLEGLIVPEVPTTLSTMFNMSPYDLIGWSTTSTLIKNQSRSYFSSLKSPTYLFPDVESAS